MAKCNRCKMEMCDSSTKTCEAYKFVEFPDGTKMTPVPYSPPDSNIRCHDCGVAAGGFHHVGCDLEICPRCEDQLLGCSCFVSDGAVSDKKVKRQNVGKPDHNCKGGKEKQNNLAIEAAVEEILEHGIELLKQFGAPPSAVYFITPKKKSVIDPFDFRDKPKAKKLLKKMAKKRRATMVITITSALISKLEGSLSAPPYFNKKVIFAYGETKTDSFGICQEFECDKNGQFVFGNRIFFPVGTGSMTGFLCRKT